MKTSRTRQTDYSYNDDDDDDDESKEREKKEGDRGRETAVGYAFLIVKISGIPDLRWLAARFNYVCHFIAGVSL